MKIAINSLLTFIFLLSASAAFSQSQCGQPFTVSEVGKIAFHNLQKETTFALGAVGYGGHTSEGEKDMDKLLSESSAQEVLFELATTNAGVGGLYGLVGLKMIKSDCFYHASQQFLKLADLPERESIMGPIPKGYVETMAGCIVGYENRANVANNIANGKFDRLLDFLNSLRTRQLEKTKSERKNP
jgi:hypothetical protein